MVDKKASESRRKLLKSIAAGSGTIIAGKNLPEKWTEPVINTVLLPAHAQTSPMTATFNYTGGSQDFIVPNGVCEVSIDAYGAEGGQFGGAIVAGLGGRAIATLPVTPGETLTVFVGGTGLAQAGGFNGGGNGGTGTGNASFGAGGGGASDIRQGGAGLANRAIVAGGGGGRSNGSAEGGDGGGTVGVTGTGTLPGGGGTQASGGSTAGNGTSGASGQGGDGGDDLTIAGGGGGGGYFGGGGGSGDPASSNAGGGGGGSGFGPAGTVFDTGVQSGPGIVSITYSITC